MAANEFIFQLAESDSDLKEAYQVRQQVFSMEQGIPEELVFDSGDGSATHFIIRDGPYVIGTARVSFPQPGMAKLERMAVLKPYRGRGLGSNMVSFIIAEMKNRDVSEITLNAQYEVVAFYQSCGFQITGLPFSEVGKKHLKMELRY